MGGIGVYSNSNRSWSMWNEHERFSTLPKFPTKLEYSVILDDSGDVGSVVEMTGHISISGRSRFRFRARRVEEVSTKRYRRLYPGH